jgi:hypothetical protein
MKRNKSSDRKLLLAERSYSTAESISDNGFYKEIQMGAIAGLLGGMSGMGEMGGLEQAAGSLEQAAGGLEKAAGELMQGVGGLEQAVSGMMGGGQGQGQSSGAGATGGQSGPQGLEQELSQALQQLSQELQQLTGGQQGGGGQASGLGGGQAGGSGQPAGISGNAAAEMPDLMNLEVDSAGNAPSSRPSHVGGDLDRLRGEVQDQMKDGNISMQAGSKALEDIGSGNVKAVEQDLSGTSGSTAGVDNMSGFE